MKFEFDGDADRGECVAYMGKDSEGYDILVLKNYGNRGIAIYSDGSIDAQYYMDEDGATRKFYKGDKITITF